MARRRRRRAVRAPARARSSTCRTARAPGPSKQVVRVDGVQFAWAIDAPARSSSGHSRRVPDHDRPTSTTASASTTRAATLIRRSQVVPGKTQKLVWTFDEPGTYQVLLPRVLRREAPRDGDDVRGEAGVIDDRDRAIARRLTLQYIGGSTAILAASGLLGVVLRWSQAVPERPRRRQLLVRDDDGARPRHVRRLGRVRRDGDLVVGPRRRRLPDPRLRARDGAADLVADGARRRRASSSRRSDHGLRRPRGSSSTRCRSTARAIGEPGRPGSSRSRCCSPGSRS